MYRKYFLFDNNKLMRKLFIFLMCLTFGCSKSNDPITTDVGVSWEQIYLAPYVKISKEKLPEWLAVRINDYYETRPPSICKVLIYEGEWNNQTVYFIMDTFSSCLCDFFTKEGGRIRDNLSDLRATSENWIIIYEYGDFVFDLYELYKN